MGNYETVDQDILSIRSLLHLPASPFPVADFCAGSGRALELHVKDTEVFKITFKLVDRFGNMRTLHS
ncbi:hypothetical protein H7C19_04835 [Cohnella nanjingensis]|uniref:Uncharacterized protein n=1 Tax=Cohnella nanjingensis TaxID=1387779 RepID=A0A7X0RMC9_9BACL|nr:hypothetical protein [Cohnella nanjingensis]